MEGHCTVKGEMFEDLLQREMTRLEFLKLIALMATSLFGVANLLQLSRPLKNYQPVPAPTPVSSFGSTKFGK